MLPPNDQNVNYYQEYCRLFIANVVLTTQMKELIAEKNEILTRISDLEVTNFNLRVSLTYGIERRKEQHSKKEQES